MSQMSRRERELSLLIQTKWRCWLFYYFTIIVYCYLYMDHGGSARSNGIVIQLMTGGQIVWEDTWYHKDPQRINWKFGCIMCMSCYNLLYRNMYQQPLRRWICGPWYHAEATEIYWRLGRSLRYDEAAGCGTWPRKKYHLVVQQPCCRSGSWIHHATIP